MLDSKTEAQLHGESECGLRPPRYSGHDQGELQKNEMLSLRQVSKRFLFASLRSTSSAPLPIMLISSEIVNMGIHHHTSIYTNIVPEHRPSQKERIVLQPSISRCELLVSGRAYKSILICRYGCLPPGPRQVRSNDCEMTLRVSQVSGGGVFPMQHVTNIWRFVWKRCR